MLQKEVVSEVIRANNLDLRGINDDGFKGVFSYLKSKTKDFTEITPELILENNQYLLILRICLGLSQKEFAKQIGTTKDWCRHTEAKRRVIINKKIAERYTNKIEKLLIDKTPNFDNALKHWNDYMFFSHDQILPEPEIQLKQISKMTEDDLNYYFSLIKIETNNFTKFDIDLLKRIPQSVLIFRIVLGIDHRKFADILGINSRTIRKYEYLEMNMKTTTAEKFTKIIKGLFSEYDSCKLNIDSTIENFRILTGLYGNRNFESMLEHGLQYAKSQESSIIEKKIEHILKSNMINFEQHAIIDGYKRKLNVDFIIYSKNKIVIEATSINISSRSISPNRPRICNIDHRFQMLKKKDPKIVTIMVLEFTGKPIFMPNVRKLIETEILNTDYYILNDELSKLSDIIKNN